VCAGWSPSTWATRTGPAGRVLIDETGDLKKGAESVGVQPEGADLPAAWETFLDRIGVPAARRSRIRTDDALGCSSSRYPEDRVAKNRVHLDVRAASGLQGQERFAALEAECDRLVALGQAGMPRRTRAAAERRPHRDGRPRGQRVPPGLIPVTGVRSVRRFRRAGLGLIGLVGPDPYVVAGRQKWRVAVVSRLRGRRAHAVARRGRFLWLRGHGRRVPALPQLMCAGAPSPAADCLAGRASPGSCRLQLSLRPGRAGCGPGPHPGSRRLWPGPDPGSCRLWPGPHPGSRRLRPGLILGRVGGCPGP
jgi:hypothetical protein